jgi:transcriptional regulator with XRE-family HTH domain
MTTELETADTKRLPEADRKEPPKTTTKHGRRKPTKGAARDGKKSVGLKKTRGKGRQSASPQAPPRTLRTDFDLSLATFAKITGVAPKDLARWEQGKAVRLDDEASGRVDRVARILEGLARVMRRTFIPTWMAQPNDACKEMGARTPLELFERGDYETLEDMVWYLESGTPS